MKRGTYRPERKTVYLDTSTMSDAFRVWDPETRDKADRSYEPLRAWIERVAREENLCLSVAHVAELAQWTSLPLAAARMARWYESLPIVWVRTFHHAALEEMAHAVLAAAGLAPNGAYHPFVGRVVDAFDQRSRGSAELEIFRARSPVLKLANAYRLAISAREEGRQPAKFGSFVAQMMRRDDENPIVSGASDEQRDEMLEANVLARLDAEIAEAQQSLADRGAPAVVGTNEIHKTVASSFHDDARTLPCFRVRYGVLHGWRDKATRTVAGKKSEKAFKGTFYDVTHAASAAYCDVFTCDAETSRWLGDLRESFGRERQLTAGEFATTKDFVEALMETSPGRTSRTTPLATR